MIKLFSCSIYDLSGEERELRCPKCGCSELWLPDEADSFADLPDYLGKTARCCECGHEFTVTENCWETTGECL